MTDDDLTALAALAAKATPGPWALDHLPGVFGQVDEMLPRGDTVLLGYTNDPADAAYIVAANPTAILALIDRTRKAEATVARIQALVDRWNDTPDYTPSHYDQGRVDQRDDMTMLLMEALDTTTSTTSLGGVQK